MRAIFKNELIQKAGVIFVFVLITIAATSLFAEPYVAWIQRYNGSANSGDYATRLALDSLGNVYVIGSSPGAGTSYDIVILKYDPVGKLFWERRFNRQGSGLDGASDVELDADGNLYVAGVTTDDETGADYTILKYDSSGNELWARHYNGIGNGTDLAADLSLGDGGSPYVTGGSWSGELTNDDLVTVNYDPQGNILGTSNYNSGIGTSDAGTHIFALADGTVFSTGRIRNGHSAILIRDNPGGIGSWSKVIPSANALLIDSKLNAYVSGGGNGLETDYTISKIDSSGNLLWTRLYNGTGNGDDAVCNFDLPIFEDRYIYVTGRSPGDGTGLDCATIKYDSSGNQLWVTRYNGSESNDDIAYAITTDGQGNVYITGSSNGHWAPGVNSSADYITIKYDSIGNQVWAHSYDGPGDSTDEAFDIAADNDGNVYITGISFGNGKNGDFATIKYSSNPILKGDLDESGVLALDDIVSLLNCVFMGAGSCPPAFADVNCDASHTPADVVVLLRTFFLVASPPC